MRHCAACASAVILLAAAAAAPADGASLVARPLTLNCGEEVPTGTLEVPPGSSNRGSTAEPPATEYLMRFDAHVRILAGRSGNVDVTGLVAGGPGAGITLERRTARGMVSTRWSTVDLIRGVRSGPAPGGSKAISETDFMPLNTVGVGSDQLGVRMECSGDVEAEAVIGTDSAVWPTAKTFPWLRLTGGSPRSAIEVRHARPISFRLRNIGSFPVDDVTVRAKVLGGKVMLVGRRSRHYRRIDGSVHGHFLLIARQPGPLRIELSASSRNANSPAILLGGDAVPPGATNGVGGGGAGLIPPIAAAVAAAGLGCFWWMRRRSRTDLPDPTSGA